MCDGDCCHCCNGGGEVWTPALLPPSQLAYWFKADAGITLGTGVSAWADQSGNGNHVSQAVGVNQPAYTPNYRNGLPGLVFDGVNDSLVRPTLTQGIINVPFRRYVVYRMPPSLSVSLKGLVGNNNTTSVTYLYQNTNRPALYNAPSSGLFNGATPAFNSFNIINTLANNTGSQVRNLQNGGADNTVTGLTGNAAMSSILIGGYGNPIGPLTFFSSGICEIIGMSLNSPVSNNLIMTYLQNKWGIYP